MRKNLHRRDALKGLGAAAMVGLAGCSGGGDTGDNSSDGGDATPTDGGSDGSGSTDSFQYTVGSNDDVAGSSLTALRFDYPDGSGAVADASVASATLGGEDVSDDLDGTSTSNNGSTMTADFGGAYSIAAEDTVAVELSGVAAPDGSYTVEGVVNPQSGATTFEQSF
ncbi:hypothetical protein [Halosegnis marinus]|uniref:Twin-arginine translocation signal domain-containing protein n=1 Tax=Halosegnis marinus TaxID=3034023 RepID=A0ABD5ZPN9_9EURY|nr:hypothetical protein [Halosegnis sp. DT85]